MPCSIVTPQSQVENELLTWGDWIIKELVDVKSHISFLLGKIELYK